MQGKLASSQIDFGYTEQFCIPGVTSVFFKSSGFDYTDTLGIMSETAIALPFIQWVRSHNRSYLNGLIAFLSFFNLSLNLAIEVHDLSHSQLLVLFQLIFQSYSIFGYKKYNQSDLGIDHLVMSQCRIISCVAGRGCLVLPECCLDKTLLDFVLHYFVLQDQTFLLFQVSLDFLLLLSNPL